MHRTYFKKTNNLVFLLAEDAIWANFLFRENLSDRDATANCTALIGRDAL